MKLNLKACTATASAAASLGCLAGSGYEGLHYSAWANPGALNYAVQLFFAAVAFFTVPAAMAVIWVVRQYVRAMRRLTPVERAVVQLTLTEVVQQIWAEQNAAESARLADSVMGPVRGQQ